MVNRKLGLIGLTLLTTGVVSGCATKSIGINSELNSDFNDNSSDDNDTIIDKSDVKTQHQTQDELNLDISNAMSALTAIELRKEYPKMFHDVITSHNLKVNQHNLKLLLKDKTQSLINSFYDESNDYSNDISDGSIDAHITLNNYQLEINGITNEINLITDWQKNSNQSLINDYQTRWTKEITALAHEKTTYEKHYNTVLNLLAHHPDNLKVPSNSQIGAHNYHHDDSTSSYLWYLYLMPNSSRYYGTGIDDDLDDNPSSQNNKSMTEGDTEANPNYDSDDSTHSDHSDDGDDTGHGNDDGNTTGDDGGDTGGDTGGDAGGGDAGGESYHVTKVHPHMVILPNKNHIEAHWL